MQEVAHLDSAIDRNLEPNHGLVEILRYAEVSIPIRRVNHQKVKICLLHLIISVQLLQDLE